MDVDPHENFRKLMDESVAGVNSGQLQTGQDRALEEHLGSCPQCRQYHSETARVLAGLKGFSFPVDPALNARIHAALAQRVQQRSAVRLNRIQLVKVSLLAVALTLLGSLADLRLSGVLAAVFDMQRTEARHDLLSFWIAPSLCILLVFPLLSRLTATAGAQAVSDASSDWKGTIQ